MKQDIPVQRWLDLLDERGAGLLASEHCRQNLLQADELLRPLGALPLHFAEFPLKGEPSLDMSWTVDRANLVDASSVPIELEGARRLAPRMSDGSVFFVEYDTSEPLLPPAGFYFKGKLDNGHHAMRSMMECVGRGSEAHGATLAVARLVKLGYVSLMCGVMAGRVGAPVRITAKPLGNFDAVRLMWDLSLLGFDRLPAEAFRQLEQVCVLNDYMFSAPIVYLDIQPDGTLGPTLGIELNGIRASNADDYLQLRLAEDWGLADGRWRTLRDAACCPEENLSLELNTLKFRWKGGEPLPAKLYLKAGW